MSDLCTVLAAKQVCCCSRLQEWTGSQAVAAAHCLLAAHLPQFCDTRQTPLYMRLVWALQYLCLPSAQGDFDARAGRECNMTCAVVLHVCPGHWLSRPIVDLVLMPVAADLSRLTCPIFFIRTAGDYVGDTVLALHTCLSIKSLSMAGQQPLQSTGS